MFSRSFMNFDEDPFFNGHRDHMREMERMMGSFGGHFGTGGSPFGMLERPRDGGRRDERSLAQRHQDPFMFGFDSMFNNMNNMMSQMHRNFRNMESQPNGFSYSSSQVMSYSNDGSGAPKYYEASSSTKMGPGGVKETQKTVRDSESGLHKMAVGHHIGDRGHVIEKSRNTRTREEEQKQDFINIDENEAGSFDQEWKGKARGFTTGRHGITGLSQHHRRHNERNTPAITHRVDRERESRDRHHERRNDDHNEQRKKVRMAQNGSHL